MPVQSCTVSFVDLDGIRHSVQVQAGSLYEAAVLAAKVFHQHGTPVPSSQPLQIEVTVPSVTHTLTIAKVRQWLETRGRNPADVSAKERLKALLPS